MRGGRFSSVLLFFKLPRPDPQKHPGRVKYEGRIQFGVVFYTPKTYSLSPKNYLGRAWFDQGLFFYNPPETIPYTPKTI